MSVDVPIAFLSYVRADDEHDGGRITALRERLEGEVRMHTGQAFKIFQDRNDIKWGHNWQERLDGTLLSVTFLVPVITPSYFYSDACCDEFDKFLLREKQLGESRLILPIYYLESDKMSESGASDGHPIAKVISSRNWADWRALRFTPLNEAVVKSAISDLAKNVKFAMKEIESVIAASMLVPPAPPPPPPAVAGHRLDDFSPQIPTLRYGSGKVYIPTDGIDLQKYHVYTMLYDEEIHAEVLSSQEELSRLHVYLGKSVALIKKNNSSLVANFLRSAKNFTHKDFSITVLIDNSGSMRGPKIMYSASWVYVISEILEKSGLPFEVLGYTTKTWKGGLSRERWLQDGKPPLPGRLNDVRHIIYKEFGSKFSQVRKNFGLMIREGILKENIDGEAILWAYDRAANFGKENHLIIIITDGAPVDDSTMSVNDKSILTSHLASVSEWVDAKANAELFAISIDSTFSSNKYYNNYIDASNLPDIGQFIVSIVSNYVENKIKN